MNNTKQTYLITAFTSMFAVSLFSQDSADVGFPIAQTATSRIHTASIPSEINNSSNNDLRSIYSSIGLLDAWNAMTGNMDIANVAVIDDSIQLNHPDLSANTIDGWAYAPSSQVPANEQGLLCDGDTHGTKVTGIIAASGNNGQGIAGIAWNNVKVYAYSLACDLTEVNISNAVKNAAQNHVSVINFSAGSFSPGFFQTLIPILEQNDILLVTSAGNYHTNNDLRAYYPASIQSPNIISVAAIDRSNQLTHWTQYGAISVDIGAPGVNVLTTGKDGGYDLISGTSAAAPMITGVAALLKAYSHGLAKAADIKAAILASVTPISNSKGRLVTDGMVNVKQAMAYLDRLSNPPPVITINKIVFDDSASVNANQVMDPLEGFSLAIELQNIWGNATSVIGNLRMQDANAIASDYGTLNTGALQTARFYINNAPDFSSFQEIPFTLDIAAHDATGGVANYQRRFNIGAGILENGKWLQHLIQRDGFDDIHYYHLNIPDDAVKVIFQLNTMQNTSLDLWVSHLSTPIVNWGEGSFSSASNSVDIGNGFRYAQLDNLPQRTKKAFAAVSHGPVENFVLDNAQRNAPYRIRACYLKSNELDGPVVSTLNQVNAQPGERITLHAALNTASVESIQWRQVSGPTVTFTGANTLNPVFTAPASGEVVLEINVYDDHCRRSSQLVKVTVVGLTLVPSSAKVHVGDYFYVSLQAAINGKAASELKMSPDDSLKDLVFDGTNINWQSANVLGTHRLHFSAKEASTGVTYQTDFILTVSNQDDSIALNRKSGGCTLSDSKNIDPILPALVLLSTLHLILRNKIRRITPIKCC